MSGSATATVSAEGIIQAACARNAAVELRYERADGTTIRARTRLLGSLPERLLADALSYEQSGQRLPVGRPLTVTMMLNGKRYEFVSVIEDRAVKIKLNAERKVRGLALRLPVAVVESQRRAHFRVSVLGRDPMTVTLVPCHPRLRDVCEIDAQPVRGKLLNVSGGGMALLVSRRELSHVRSGQRFFLTFQLSAEPDEFVMMGVVRHSVLVASSDCLRLGIAFLPWGGSDLRTGLRLVMDFVSDCERTMLRRRK